MTEKEKAKAGMPYNNNYDPELLAERRASQKKCQRHNLLDPEDMEGRSRLVKEIFGSVGEGFCIEQPFQCDMGYNTHIGKKFFANYNLVILDSAKVTIGDNVFLGPDCGIYTTGHPVNVKQRVEGIEYAMEVKIGNNVWVGGGVKIMPGVTIGDNSIIGSGSIVTKDIPAGVIAVGCPCKVLKEVEEEDLP